MAAGRSVSYELYYLQHGRWSIHARYSFRERDTAIEEAKSLEKQGHVEAACVVRESFDYSTNRSSESVIYHSPSLKAKPPVSFITSGAATGERKRSANAPAGSAAANAAKEAKARKAKSGGAKKAVARKNAPANAASEPPVPQPPLPDPPLAEPPAGRAEGEVIAEGDYSAILPKLVIAFIIASVVATVAATLLFYLIKVIVKLGIAVDPGLGQGILIGSWALVWGGIFIPMTKRAFDLVKVENRRIQRARLRKLAERRAAAEAAARVLAGDEDDEAGEAGEAAHKGKEAEDIGPGAEDIVYASSEADSAGSGDATAAGKPGDAAMPASATSEGAASTSTAQTIEAGAGATRSDGVKAQAATPRTMASSGGAVAGGAAAAAGGVAGSGAAGSGAAVSGAVHREKARADSVELSNNPNAVEPIPGGVDGLREELQLLADEAREILGERLDGDAFLRFGVILFMSGAGETLARRCRVGQAEMRAILTDIVQGFSIPEAQARGFTHNVDEYLLDRRYFAMYSAGREGAMRQDGDDPSGLKPALDDWRNAARQQALRAAGSMAGGDPHGRDRGRPNDPDQSFVAVMFTDIVDSTTRQQELGDAWMMNVVRAHNEIVREVLKKHSGREIKHTGDGIMATFAVVANAVEAALAMQAGFARFSERMPGYAFAVRVGLSAGEPIHESGDVFGTPVNLAARVLSHAADGDTAVSAIAREMCRGKGLQFEEIGRFELKGFDEPQPIYRAADKRSLPVDLEFGAVDRVVKDVEAAEAAEGADTAGTAEASPDETAAPVVERSVPGDDDPPSLSRREPTGEAASPQPAQKTAKKTAGRRKRPAPGTVRKAATTPAPPRVPRSPGPARDDGPARENDAAQDVREAEKKPADMEDETLSSAPERTRVTRIGGGQPDG